MIEVILLERIEGLGTLGQTVKVRPGFARNYLLPNKKALRATKENLELFEKQKAELEARNAADRAAAEKVAAKMANLSLIVVRQASEMGQLFGSVSSRDIAEVAVEAGHKILRSQVHVDTPIKTLGLFKIKVKLHPEVSTVITVNVARSAEEAVMQAEKGAALLKAAEKADKAAAAAVEAAVVEAEAAPEVVAAEAEEAKKPAKKKSAKKADAAEGDAEPKAKKPTKKAKKADAE